MIPLKQRVSLHGGVEAALIAARPGGLLWVKWQGRSHGAES